MQTVLVTGSSGTIGTRLCEMFLANGYIVVGIDKVPNRWSSIVQQHTIVTDLLDPATYNKIPTKIDAVVHLAANARVYDSVVNPSLAIENIQMMCNILEWTRIAGVRKFIFASSREVYGAQETMPVSEDAVTIAGSESPYTASKAAGEAFVHAYSKCFGIDSVIIRFSNVYGRYDESQRLVPLLVRKTLAREPLTIYGAEKTYDFTYIDDAAGAVIRIMEAFNRVAGQTFNIATGKGTSLLDVARLLQSIIGIQTPITVKENRVGELMFYVADISKARALLGYESTIDVEEGLRRAVDWHLKVTPAAATISAKNTT